jgi:Fic family protein
MSLNNIISKQFQEITQTEMHQLISELIRRLQIEFRKQDKSGIYGKMQCSMAYNSNKIEGSTLTEKQTVSLFETGTLPVSEEIYKAKDIEEMSGHFLMFNEMLKTLQEPLSNELIKKYHFSLKSGVFEDKANGYPIGEYKNRINKVYDIETVTPDMVEVEMNKLLQDYLNKNTITLKDILEFHARYEAIHPFQDGNGRTGRIIMLKECLKNSICPFIITDQNRSNYVHALNKAQKQNEFGDLVNYIEVEQRAFYKELQAYLYVYDTHHLESHSIV